ncbi:MAG TPA: hypothetical protein VJ572_02635 [Azonexus sp.]|nr:hypothetical protein [Azonexus sp.]
MKAQKILVALLVLMTVGTGSAFAHGGRAHVGVYFGPMWSPWYYPPPYYYEPRVVVVPPSPPPVYIEQSDPAAGAPSGQQYWYYCKSAKGYYPYVKECPDGWQKVMPEPAR